MSRTLFGVLSLVWLVLAGCGSRSEDAPPPEPPADATTVALRVAVDLPDTLRLAVEDWAAERRARVEWSVPEVTDGITLTEIDATEVVARVRAGELREFPDDAIATQWLDAAGRVDDSAYGLPWRADVTALAADAEPTWPGLARRGEAMLMVDGHETPAFFALAAASGSGPEPGSTHDLDLRSGEAVEALTFLRRLAVRARRVGADDEWPAGVTAAVLGSAQRERVPAGVGIHAFPGPESGETERVVARVRLLVVPVRGPHGDLGIELARWLAAPERANLLHAVPGDGIALHRESSDDAVGAWLALRGVACLPPTASDDAAAWNAMLDDAVRAAVERRRSPEAALDEAWARR